MTERKDHPLVTAALEAAEIANALFRAGMRAAGERLMRPSSLIETALITKAATQAAAPDKPVADLSACGARVNRFAGIAFDARALEDMQAHLGAARDRTLDLMAWLYKAKMRAFNMAGAETAEVIEAMRSDLSDALADTIEAALSDIAELLAKARADAELPATDRAKLERAQRGEERE